MLAIGRGKSRSHTLLQLLRLGSLPGGAPAMLPAAARRRLGAQLLHISSAPPAPAPAATSQAHVRGSSAPQALAVNRGEVAFGPRLGSSVAGRRDLGAETSCRDQGAETWALAVETALAGSRLGARAGRRFWP